MDIEQGKVVQIILRFSICAIGGLEVIHYNRNVDCSEVNLYDVYRDARA